MSTARYTHCAKCGKPITEQGPWYVHDGCLGPGLYSCCANCGQPMPTVSRRYAHSDCATGR